MKKKKEKTPFFVCEDDVKFPFSRSSTILLLATTTFRLRKPLLHNRHEFSASMWEEEEGKSFIRFASKCTYERNRNIDKKENSLVKNENLIQGRGGKCFNDFSFLFSRFNRHSSCRLPSLSSFIHFISGAFRWYLNFISCQAPAERERGNFSLVLLLQPRSKRNKKHKYQISFKISLNFETFSIIMFWVVYGFDVAKASNNR